MSDYRWLAKFYPLCERLIFRNALQQCRTAFLHDLPQRVLIVGEGDGRFSQAFLRINPEADLIIIEPDTAMRTEGLKRSPQARWQKDWKNIETVEAVVMNFILDCCSADEVTALIQRSEDLLIPSGPLIIGDFFPNETPLGWKRNLATYTVRTMYLFFQIMTGMQTRKLPPIRAILEAQGWQCTKEETQWSGFIRAQWWLRPTKKPTPNESGSTL